MVVSCKLILEYKASNSAVFLGASRFLQELLAQNPLVLYFFF